MPSVMEATEAARRIEGDADALLLTALRGIVRGHVLRDEIATLQAIAADAATPVESAEWATRVLAWMASARRRGVLVKRRRA